MFNVVGNMLDVTVYKTSNLKNCVLNFAASVKKEHIRFLVISKVACLFVSIFVGEMWYSVSTDGIYLNVSATMSEI